MKSLIVSVLFTAWLLGVEPAKRILCISSSDDLTRQLSRLTRRVMTSRRYHRICPGTVLSKQAEDLLTTPKGGQRLATAVGGAVAGVRSELTIIDDPMQPDEVASELKAFATGIPASSRAPRSWPRDDRRHAPPRAR
jgi:hypothetical protein